MLMKDSSDGGGLSLKSVYISGVEHVLEHI